MATAISKQRVVFLMAFVSLTGIWVSCDIADGNNRARLPQSTSDVAMSPMPLRAIDMLVIQQREETSWTTGSSPVAKLGLTIDYVSGTQKTFRLEVIDEESFAFQEQNSPVTKKMALDRLQKLVRKPTGGFIVHLVHETTVHAKWVENEPEFYPEHYSPIPQHILVVAPNKENDKRIEIKLEKVVSIQVNWQAIPGNSSRQKAPVGGPVTCVLKNNQSFKTGDGYIRDYCGHWYSTNWHTRLSRWGSSSPWQVEVIDDSAEGQGNSRTIDCAALKEIEFTGKFSPKWLGCREIVLKFRDGSSQKTNLYLTGESYGGICYANNARRSDLDCVVGKTDDGRFEIPLDGVSKIIFTEPEDAEQERSTPATGWR